MINAVITRFGLARMPFGRDLPPSRLHRHRDCGEAAARITWAVADKTICMVTGEVGTGKTVAIRAAVADLDPTQDEHEDDAQDEHVEPDIPGAGSAVRAHGGAVVLTVTR